MKYDPDALPFWEKERGDGPITRRLDGHSYRARLERTKKELARLRAVNWSHGPHDTVYARIRRLEMLKHELKLAIKGESHAVHDYDDCVPEFKAPTNGKRDGEYLPDLGNVTAVVRDPYQCSNGEGGRRRLHGMSIMEDNR